MHLEPCAIIEIPLGSTDSSVREEIWAAFLILEVNHRLDGSMLLSVDLLGCETIAGATLLAEHFGEGQARIHLCIQGRASI